MHNFALMETLVIQNYIIPAIKFKNTSSELIKYIQFSI